MKVRVKVKGARTNAVVRAWERTLRRCGAKRALVEAASGAEWTFAEIDEGARAWWAAQALEATAVCGRAVVFAVPNGVQWLEIFLAVMRGGGVAVPLDGGEPVEAQRRTAEALRAGFWWDGTRLREVGGGRAKRYRDEATCLIKLTSGSTGRPRPLVFTAEQMLADARQVTATMGIGGRDTNYALIPFGHSYGLGNLSLPLVAQGVSVVCGSMPLPQVIAEEIARWRPTVWPTVPAVLRGLVVADVAPEKLASLRTVISAGAPLPVEVARAFAEKFGKRVHSFYGSSETGGIAYDRTGAVTLRGGVGRAMRGVTVRALPRQRIEVSSAAVFTMGNARRRGGVGAWVLPDLAEVGTRGEVRLLGRRGATVKIGGRRVNLGEVAARLRRVAGVKDVWVGVDAAEGAGEAVLGAALATGRAVMDVRAEVAADTASWKVPKRWALMDEFPVSRRGKTDTEALRRAVFGARKS